MHDHAIREPHADPAADDAALTADRSMAATAATPPVTAAEEMVTAQYRVPRSRPAAKRAAEAAAMTGPRPRSRALGQWPSRGLAAAAAAGTVIALAACSSQHPPAGPAPTGPGTAAASPAAKQGTTLQVGGTMDVINARIPAPPGGSSTAQVEVTLADVSTAGPDRLMAASSPDARAIVFTSKGHAVQRIDIPVAAGFTLSVGPPNPDRILLTGLRHQLHTGQTVTITLVFARAGQATIQVPVIPPVP